MAIWQFKIYLVKKENIKPEYYSKMTENEMDTAISWVGFEADELSIKRIEKILPKEKSWSDKIVQYGNLEGTCLELFYHEECLNNVSFKLDVRNLPEEVIREIVQFIKINNCNYICERGLFEPSYENLTEAINKSQAFQFCENPRDYLKNLEQSKSKYKK